MHMNIHTYLPKRANLARGQFDEAEGLVAIIHGLYWAIPPGVKPLKSTCKLNFI